MSGALRILHLVQKPQRRGAEVFALQLATKLEQRGHETRIAYLYPYDGEAQLPLRPGDLGLDGVEGSPWERLPGFHPVLVRRVQAAIREFDPQVVQANGARTLKYGSLARRSDHGWALIYRNIGDPAVWIHGWARSWAYRRLFFPAVDGVVGVSEWTLANLRQFYDLEVPAVHIPRGVEPSDLVPKREKAKVRVAIGTPEGARVAVYVGSLTPEKRIDRLLRVAAKIAARLESFELWVVGSGPEAALRASTADHGERLVIRWLGQQADIASYLAAADLLLLTSDTEGLPGVVLEAACLALPTVGTRVGGVPEAIEHGATGLLFEPEDEQGFAEGALALLEDPEETERLGVAAQHRVLTGFTLDTLVERYVDFYRQTLETL